MRILLLVAIISTFACSTGNDRGAAIDAGLVDSAAPDGQQPSPDGGTPSDSSPGELPLTPGRWVQIPRLNSSTLGDVTPVKLLDGSVLLIGGFRSAGVLRYSPESDTIEREGDLPEARGNFGVALLEDGRVLLAGGSSDESRDGMTTCLLYDPSSGEWQSTGELPVPRAESVLIGLPSGNVLLVGGVGPGVGGSPAVEAFEFDVAGEQWLPRGVLDQPARFHRLFLQGEQEVVVVSENPQVYDFELRATTRTPSLPVFRRDTESVQLQDGTVLAIGGAPRSRRDGTPFAEMDALVEDAPTWSGRSPLSLPRVAHGAVTLTDGTVMVAGGVSTFESTEDDPARLSAERYLPTRDEWVLEAPAPVRTGGNAVLLDDGSVLFVSGDLLRFIPSRWM